MIHSRLVCFMLLVVIALPLLTGCGSDNATQPQPDEKSTESDLASDNIEQEPAEWIITSEVGAFDSDLYQNDFIAFSPEKLLGKEVYFGEVTNPEELAEKVETVWFELFGESNIKEQRPYVVRYDNVHEIWWIVGNTDYLKDPEGGEPSIGGVAYAFINNDDGKLLAVYHDE